METKDINNLNVSDILDKEVDMKTYINKLIKEIKDDLEVYEIIRSLGLTVGEVKDNIGRLTDYKDDYNYCKNCPGIDKCGKKIPHVQMAIKKVNSFIVADYQPCSKIIEQIKQDSNYLVRDFPKEWKSSTLKTLDLSANRRPVIKEFAKILNGTSDRWLYLTGNHKVGKSFLLVTFANEFVSLGKGQVAVMNCPDKIKKLADLSYIDAEQFAKEIYALGNVDLLILDDFGEEYKNEFIRDSIILPILSERDRRNKPTFFTSEFSIVEIKELYSVGKTGAQIRAKQLEKLLLEMCKSEFDLTGTPLYRK